MIFEKNIAFFIIFVYALLSLSTQELVRVHHEKTRNITEINLINQCNCVNIRGEITKE